MAQSYKEYIEALFTEKGIDMDQILEIEGESGLNLIPVQIVYDHILNASHNHQPKIRETFVKIDFKNGDILHFVKHLAQAIAI